MTRHCDLARASDFVASAVAGFSATWVGVTDRPLEASLTRRASGYLRDFVVITSFVEVVGGKKTPKAIATVRRTMTYGDRRSELLSDLCGPSVGTSYLHGRKAFRKSELWSLTRLLDDRGLVGAGLQGPRPQDALQRPAGHRNETPQTANDAFLQHVPADLLTAADLANSCFAREIRRSCFLVGEF